MLSQEIRRLERENIVLKEALKEIESKIEKNEVSKPKSCRYCKNYIQHYANLNGKFQEIYAGHCTCGVPVKKGTKRKPNPDDTCPYFEIGTYDMKYM